MIVTFYSYKGGVGRSMALMNVAEILADVGYSVIVCDFDLEAPGLERYATDDIALVNQLRGSNGVIDLLEEYRETLAAASPVSASKCAEAEPISVPEGFRDINGLSIRRPSNCAIAISSPNTGRLGQIRFLGAGRRDGKWANRYSERVQQFDWSDFYRRWAGAAYVDFFREDLTEGQTIVLIDSRTGVTEYAGICTHHLADLVVLLSAPNDLNIDGTKWMASTIATAELDGLRGSRPLQVMPVAARVETASQVEELAAFRERFEREFAASVPSAVGNAREFIQKTEIPYIPYFAFTEKVVARRNVSPHRELYGAYEALARGVINVGLDAGMLTHPLRQHWLTPVTPTARITIAPDTPSPSARVWRGSGSPYLGLNAFEERDAAFFFGRETAAAALLERMSRLVDGPGLLVVSGVSGAGKSSLVRAGMLPRLRQAGLASAPEAASWPCIVLTPGRGPLDELAVPVASLARVDAVAVRRELAADPAGFALVARQAALAQVRPAAPPVGPSAEQQPPPRLLLVIDQFEQLFTQCRDEDQRKAFILALAAAATAGHDAGQVPAAMVVLVVRADFEARCADYPQLAGAVQDRYLLTSMTERQIRMAITGPARAAGSSVEDDLVDVLLREVGSARRLAASPDVPGGGALSGGGMLPLLSYALDKAWRSRTGEALTLADYERTGGIEGAVADSAQRAYDRLTPAQQAAARLVFLRLTATGPDGVSTAERVSRAELTEGKTAAEVDDVQAVLEAFAAERLLTLAADTVEISHEVLLTAWPLLRDSWLAESRADLIVRTRLHDNAAEWKQHSRDPSYLYSGSLLAAATATADRDRADHARYPPLSPTELEFLHASDRARRRRARLLIVLGVLVVLFAGLASFALVSSIAHR